jgi:hypothetical protein
LELIANVTVVISAFRLGGEQVLIEACGNVQVVIVFAGA